MIQQKTYMIGAIMTSSKKPDYIEYHEISGEPLVKQEVWIKRAKLMLKGLVLNSTDQVQLIHTVKEFSKLFNEIALRKENFNIFTAKDCEAFIKIFDNHIEHPHLSSLQDDSNSYSIKERELGMRLFNASDKTLIDDMEHNFSFVNPRSVLLMKFALEDYANKVEIGNLLSHGSLLKSSAKLKELSPEVMETIPHQVIDYIQTNKVELDKKQSKTYKLTV